MFEFSLFISPESVFDKIVFVLFISLTLVAAHALKLIKNRHRLAMVNAFLCNEIFSPQFCH